MHTIHKGILRLHSLPQEVQMYNLSADSQAKIVHVGEQTGSICIWFECDTDQEVKSRTFCILGTGHPIPPDGKHVGTVIMGTFVWHVYELTP